MTAVGTANAEWEPQGPGAFFLPGDTAIAPNGCVYVAGFQENKVEVFCPDAGAPTGYSRGLGINTGEPGTTAFDANGVPTSLNGPYGLMVDDRERLVVGDTDNNRLAVFLPPGHPENTLPGGGWQFAFQLVAKGEIVGSWLSMVRQDSFGRWLASSVVRDVVHVFQVPELALFGSRAEQTITGDTARVLTNIAVPVGKPFASDVTGSVDVTLPFVNPATLWTPVGPFLVAPGDDPFDPAYDGGSAFASTDIGAGEYAQIYWDYPLLGDGGTATFEVSARKQTPAGDVEAPPVSVPFEAVSGGCVAPVLDAPLFSQPRFEAVDPALGVLLDVYGWPLWISLTATQEPEGVREIRHDYTEGPLNGTGGGAQRRVRCPGGALGFRHLDRPVPGGGQLRRTWIVARRAVQD